MKTLMAFLLLFLGISSTDVVRKRGAEIPVDARTTRLSAVFAHPTAFVNERLVTEGVVANVCRWAGCWMTVGSDSGGPTMRVTFRGFRVSRDLRGRRVRLVGRVKVVDNKPSFVAEGIEAAASSE